MKKRFNVNGLCYPQKHYMVNLNGRLEKIKELVDYGDYFVINRARQYGKTTTLRALKQYLQKEYAVILISFLGLSESDFQNEYDFVKAFWDIFYRSILNEKDHEAGLDDALIEKIEQQFEEKTNSAGLRVLFERLSKLCETSKKPVVLMIDEVDSATNNRVFVDFLGLLRDYYLNREDMAAFQSVVLAGVYDIKNLKQKIRPEEEHRYNSPWNIAASFDVDMSFSSEDIAGMLKEYEDENGTGMDIQKIAELIYEYTAGYPYLVSKICKLVDEKITGTGSFKTKKEAWTRGGILEAVKELMKISNSLFDDMRKKIEDYPELRIMLYAILFQGKRIFYNPDNYAIDIAAMFGFVKEKDGMVAVANRIFETRLYNLFMSEEAVNSESYNAAERERSQFIKNGLLDMDQVMKKFMEHFNDIYNSKDEKFVEEYGRKLFLLYLKPIINGTGNYYVEAQTRDMLRTDVVVDYCGKQYIIEMKIWHGEEYNCRGEKQLVEYLESYHLDKGYMLSFNFNKNKEVGLKTIEYAGKTIVEVVV